MKVENVVPKNRIFWKHYFFVIIYRKEQLTVIVYSLKLTLDMLQTIVSAQDGLENSKGVLVMLKTQDFRVH